MRRKRCPHCESLNTVPYVAGDGKEITETGWVCDDCDCSWRNNAEAAAIRAERDMDIPKAQP